MHPKPATLTGEDNRGEARLQPNGCMLAPQMTAAQSAINSTLETALSLDEIQRQASASPINGQEGSLLGSWRPLRYRTAARYLRRGLYRGGRARGRLVSHKEE